MNIKYRQTCRICGNPHLTEVIDLGEQYFQGSFIKKGVPSSPLRKVPNLVVRCDTSKYEYACGLIQTKHTIPPEILYTNYWYESGISQTMRDHLKNIVNDSLNITGFKEGTVLDIASNDNTLLRNYPSSFDKFGIDPSNIAAKQKDKDIVVINELFPSTKLKEKTFGIITSIACYYDIENPVSFALAIKNLLTPNGIWIFEVAYWPSMLKNLAYDSIVNEHIIHYHLAPLEFICKMSRLKIFNVIETPTNGGSIKVYVCKEDCDKYDTDENKQRLIQMRMQEFCYGLDDDKIYNEFRKRVHLQRDKLYNLITSLVERGKTIHILGASTKLNTILGYCNIGPELIKYAAERSPEKWGAKTISGIEIISEEESRAMKPDYYLVGPYHFKDEIIKRETESIKNGVGFIFPLPRVEVI